MKKKTKKIVRGIGIGIIGLGLGLAGGYALMPEKTITEQVPVPYEVEKIVEVEVPQECPTCEECPECVIPVTEEEYNNTVTQLENTQEELLSMEGAYNNFLIFVYDVDGDVEFILDELDDDEVGLIADRIGFVYDAISISENEVNDELADELDDEIFNVSNDPAVTEDIEFDEDDIEDIDPKVDLDDIEFSNEDFEDDEITLNFNVEFEHDDEDFTANVDVEIKDGEVEDFDINSVKRDE